MGILAGCLMPTSKLMLEVCYDTTGLMFITSPDIRGLLVAEANLQKALKAVYPAIHNHALAMKDVYSRTGSPAAKEKLDQLKVFVDVE